MNELASCIWICQILFEANVSMTRKKNFRILNCFWNISMSPNPIISLAYDNLQNYNDRCEGWWNDGNHVVEWSWSCPLLSSIMNWTCIYSETTMWAIRINPHEYPSKQLLLNTKVYLNDEEQTNFISKAEKLSSWSTQTHASQNDSR